MADEAGLREALIAMVYVHPCNCASLGRSPGACARCRAVEKLGFDPAQITPCRGCNDHRLLHTCGAWNDRG